MELDAGLCWPDLADSILAFLLWFCSWCCLQFLFEFCKLFLVVLLMIKMVSLRLNLQHLEKKQVFPFHQLLVGSESRSSSSFPQSFCSLKEGKFDINDVIWYLNSLLILGVVRIKWEALCLNSVVREQYDVCSYIFSTWLKTLIPYIPTHKVPKTGGL